MHVHNRESVEASAIVWLWIRKNYASKKSRTSVLQKSLLILRMRISRWIADALSLLCSVEIRCDRCSVQESLGIDHVANTVRVLSRMPGRSVCLEPASFCLTRCVARLSLVSLFSANVGHFGVSRPPPESHTLPLNNGLGWRTDGSLSLKPPHCLRFRLSKSVG